MGKQQMPLGKADSIDRISAPLGSQEYARSFRRQSINAGQRAARMWIVRAACALLCSVCLIDLLNGEHISVASVYSLLFIVKLGAIALFGKSLYLFFLSGFGRERASLV